jgi:hypothetical protein
VAAGLLMRNLSQPTDVTGGKNIEINNYLFYKRDFYRMGSKDLTVNEWKGNGIFGQRQASMSRENCLTFILIGDIPLCGGDVSHFEYLSCNSLTSTET